MKRLSIEGELTIIQVLYFDSKKQLWVFAGEVVDLITSEKYSIDYANQVPTVI